jgi:two-component system, cell cycle sensor histidine kinase and response regulator CckA
MTSAARVSEPNFLDEPTIARALRMTLVAILASALAISAVTLFLKWRHTPQLALVAGASSVIALVLSRYGRIRPAMMLPLLTIIYAVLHLAARSDGIQNIGLAILPVLIMVGSLVLERRMLVLFTAGIILAVAGMLAVRYFVLRAERFSTNDMGDLFIFALTCATAALLGRLLAARIQEGFRLVRDGESRYRRIFENVQDVYYEMNTDGVLLELSPASSTLFGVAREAMVGSPLAEFCADRSASDALLEALRTYGRVSNCELVVRDSHGELRTALVNASLQNGFKAGEERVIGSIRDITERKRLEEELRRHAEELQNALLRESEERFRNVADTAPVMIWAVGTDGLANFFNQPWLDFRGRTLEQELGKGWIGAVHPEDWDACSAVYSLAFDSRRPFRKECRLRRADGEYRWVLDNGIPLYRAGEFAGFIGSCIDITEQKLIEERLRASEARLKDAQRLTKVGSWERHLEADRIYWSEEMLRILGLPDGSLSSFSEFLNSVHPNDREKVLEVDRKIRSTDAAADVEYRLIQPDGEVRFARSIAEAIRSDQGAIVRIVGATQDVTEQVRAEQLLRESEGRLKRAERLAHVGHWHRDLKSGQVIWSEESLRIFGRPLGYTPSKDEFFQVVAPQDRELVERRIKQILAAKSGGSIEFRITRPDGDQRTIMAVFEVFPDEEGSPARVFGAVRDITDESRAQEENVARQKLESVGTLASGIAHDFNNLLGGVLAQAELAISELAAGVNPEEELRAIRDVAIRGSEIVRELMIYAGKETAAVGLVDVSRIVREMLELLKVSVSKHAEMETDLEEGLPAVRANAAQLRQIVMNLVTNASDAIGDRDGVIRVSTRRLKAGQKGHGEISDRATDADYLELEVSDTGCGISQEARGKVFDPFFTTKAAGHGLGLAIVQGIVRSLSGEIHLTSDPGKGTTFQIWLPCAETTAEANPGATSGIEKLPSRSRYATVLVVEDEDPLRQAVTKTLRKTGFEVLEAADGTSAVDLIRANRGKIDVMLLDATIPGASSAEVVAEAAKAQPAIKVILTSAYSHEMLTPAVNAFEVCGFIRKPFQLRELVRTLRGAVLN